MFSTIGRPRFLTDAQIRKVLEWQRTRKTLIQVARENGVSPATIYALIRNEGHYKRRSPDATPHETGGRTGRASRRRSVARSGQ